MFYKEINAVFLLVFNDPIIRFLAIAVTLSTFLIVVFYSLLAGLVIYFYYLLGFAICWVFLKYQTKSTTYFKRLASFYRGRISVKKKPHNSCNICDNLSCTRHQQSKSVLPWKYLIINKDLDAAIEHFYNRIIENFVTSWYADFTDDKDFQNELRYALRHTSATLINRFLEINPAEIIANKLIPCAIKHIDDYLYMQQCAKLKNIRFNDVIVEYLGKRLHAAASNRKNELEYLRNVVAALLEEVVPTSHLNCKNYSVLIREILTGWVFLPLMDVLADPNILNSLEILILTYNYKGKKVTKAEPIENVVFLESFLQTDAKRVSSFATDLNTIKNKKNTDLLYALMQFLKKQESVNLLQFCLDVDDFNSNLLIPDLSKQQLELLHADALKLYNEYLDPNSYSYIFCSKEISDNFHSLLKDGVYNVAKLRTSKPLFQAYDHTFNLLESVWLPQFFHSTEFYVYICGTKTTPTYKKAPTSKFLAGFGSPIKDKNKRYYEGNMGAVSKISSGLGKIRGALKPNQPIEGAIYPLESQNIEDGTVEDLFLADCENIFRDMSTWKVSINTSQSSPTNKVIYFCVNVQVAEISSRDAKTDWIILRKDQDFYNLKAKLVEFHGEGEICDSPLPSRKAGSSLDERMSKYQEFIRKLLKKPTLRASELLYTFLTTEEDFTLFIATHAPVVQDFYQSVALKLRKEKGQHLDGFISTFFSSTGHSKTGTLDLAEIGDELDSISEPKNLPLPKTYRNHIFNDNFGVPFNVSKDTSCSLFKPNGITDSIFYLLKHIFKVQHGFLKLYVALCSIFREAIDYLCQKWIRRLLQVGLTQSNLAYLIRLLEDVVFQHHTSPTKEELEERKLRAFNLLKTCLSPRLVKFSDGFCTILEILQNPHYNKQFVYNLLDIVLLEMYPKIGADEKKI